MAEIPPFIFIIIGIIVAAVSIYINTVQKGLAMTVFIFVGIAFVLWGVAKMQKII